LAALLGPMSVPVEGEMPWLSAAIDGA